MAWESNSSTPLAISSFLCYFEVTFLYNSAQYCIVLYNPEKSALFLVEAQKARNHAKLKKSKNHKNLVENR